MGGYTLAAGGYIWAMAGHTQAMGGYTSAAGWCIRAVGGYTQGAAGHAQTTGGYTSAAGGCIQAVGGYSRREGGYTQAAERYTQVDEAMNKSRWDHNESGRATIKTDETMLKIINLAATPPELLATACRQQPPFCLRCIGIPACATKRQRALQGTSPGMFG